MELPRTRRTVKSRPAKLRMTVFGKPFTTQVSQNPMIVSDQSVPEVGKPDRADTAKRASDDLKQSDAKRHRPGETLEPQENHQKGNQSSGGGI